MSRLIFEGDTTKRFGEKFPRPFIEQVRAYDNGMEVDIAFYFKVSSNDEDVEDFIDSLKAGDLSQSIVLSAVNQSVFNSINRTSLLGVLVSPRDSGFSFSETDSPTITNIVSFADFVNGNSSAPPALWTPEPSTPYSFFDEGLGLGFGRDSESEAEGRPSTPSIRDTGFGFGGATDAGGGGSGAGGSGDGPERPLFGDTGFGFGGSGGTDDTAYNAGIKDDFYSLDGQRYIKIFGTLQLDYTESGALYACCFVKNGLFKEFFEGQTSDLIYEKVLNEDRTLTTDPVVGFLESDGNFYHQTPLMSLAKTYHKTDDYGHREVIKQFTDVLQNYRTDESDSLLTILNTESNNPKLLIMLKNKIDNFTNKTLVTETGKLYSQMASNIVLADTLITKQAIVTKRQFTNAKIADFRNILLPNLQKKESNSFNYALYGDFFQDEAFLPTPLISRTLAPLWEPTEFNMAGNYLLGEGVWGSTAEGSADADSVGYFKFAVNGYYFIDYEKLLNYQSQISKIFNPYIIQQIFGKGSLSNFFYYTSHSLNIVYDNADFLYVITYEQGVPVNSYRGYSGDAYDISPIAWTGIEGTYAELSDGGGGVNKFIKWSVNDEETIYCQFVPRYLNTLQNIGDYRISCFELTHIEYPTKPTSGAVNYELFEGTKTYTWRTNTADETMVFYDRHIRQKIMTVNDALKKYFDFASDFCSYNNIDNKFNDFFNQTIRNEFDEPYPWQEAPLYYNLFFQMIKLSLDDSLTRKRDGEILDLDSIKTAAKIISKSINPATGDLKSLEQFSTMLDDFVGDYFVKGGSLDQKFSIYESGGGIFSDGYNVRLPYFVRSVRRDDNVDYSDYAVKIVEDEDNGTGGGLR